MDVQTVLDNPLGIQLSIIKEFQSRLNGEEVVVDSNNTFCFLLEAFSRTVAEATIATDAKLKSVYPRRACNTKELYNHLSDYDYVGFFSSPASLRMAIMLHKDYLIRNAVEVPNSNYKLVVIPADTIFTVGRFKLGLYYPIHIRINSIVKSVSAVYDTTNENPLYSLNSNVVPVKTVSQNGIDLIIIEFDTFQFDKTVINESINKDLGFTKKYQFADKFYAARVFDIGSGKDKEMSYTLSDSVYDPNKATALLKVYPETNEVEITIPHIYFTNNLIGNRIRIELFTTQGELDASLSNLQLEDVKANFAMTSQNVDLTYTNILKNIPTIVLAPIDNRIVGGSNGQTFQQMKDFTVYHTNSEVVPVTRLNMERYFETKGFKAFPKIDNLTDRRYYAFKKLYFKDSVLGDTDLSIANGALTINAIERDQNESIIYHANGNIVILPTALYRFIKNIKKFEVLNDASRNTIVSAAPKQLSKMLNDDPVFCNPHHIVINANDRYPSCVLYDLFTTEATSITFVEENVYLSSQLNIVSTALHHLGDGSKGYVLRVGVVRSEDLKSTNPNDINIYLSIETRGGFRVGLRGMYVGTFGDVDAFDFNILTNYKLTGNAITVTNLMNSNGYTLEHDIDLKGTMFLACFIKKSMYPTIPQNQEILARLVEDDNSWLAVSMQKFDYKLGSSLVNVLDTNLISTWTGLKYQSYDHDIELRYDHDVYETNPDGTIKYTIDPVTNDIVLNKLKSIGDVVTDELGATVYKYRTGDTVLDASGNPVIISNRTQDFTIDISTFDYRHHEVHSDFFINLSSTLDSYYNAVLEIDQNILENTKVYFRPIMTAGDGTYKLNNVNTMISTLELMFELNCYVSQAVSEDPSLLTMIKREIVKIIQDGINAKILSITSIVSNIREVLSDYVNSVDIVSMNGDKDIQTLVNVETEKLPRLGMELAVSNDGKFTFDPKVKINFRSLDG